jgi:hypothetical protein
MSTFLLLYAGVDEDTTGPLDPGTLSPAEHYKEDSWDVKEWVDSIGSTAKWDAGDGIWQTATTKNSLFCYEGSGSGNLTSTTTPKAQDSFNNTGDLTMYYVYRWDGTINDTMTWMNGNQTNEIFRIKFATGNKHYTQFTDSSSTSLISYPDTPTYSGGDWFVTGIRLKNQTNDGELTIVHKQSKGTPITDATWLPTDFTSGVIGANKLWTNNTGSETYDGVIAEIIQFTDYHSDETMLRVNQFLQNKWDIT